MTLSEVLKSAKDLKDSAERLETKLNQTDRQVALEQGKLKSLISKIQEELHIGKLLTPFYENSSFHRVKGFTWVTSFIYYCVYLYLKICAHFKHILGTTLNRSNPTV